MIKTIYEARRNFIASTGLNPNIVLIGRAEYKELKKEVEDFLKFTPVRIPEQFEGMDLIQVNLDNHLKLAYTAKEI